MVLIFVGGGTLGHIYPALPVIKQWKKNYPDNRIVFITTSKETEKKAIAISEIDEAYYFEISGINRRNFLKNFKLIKLIPKTNKRIRQILKKEKPKVVIGMGGYLSGLVLKQAQKLKIKTIVHEQNSVLGLANKLVVKRVNFLLSSFELDIKYPYHVIGNPRLDEAKRIKVNKLNTFSLLVVSGSLGAEAINNTVVEFLKTKESHHYLTTLVTGKRYYDDVMKKLIIKTTSHYQILPFTNQMLSLMNKADVIISRAGATTLFEIIGMEKPSIIIPSPNVSYNHQVKNAKLIEQKEIGIVIDEKDFTKEKLNEVLKIIFRPSQYHLFQKNLKKISSQTPTTNFIEFIKKAINQ